MYMTKLTALICLIEFGVGIVICIIAFIAEGIKMKKEEKDK